MKFADFHCDTIGECFNQNKPLYSNDLHISLERAAEIEKYIQLFAVWIPDDKRKEAAVGYFKDVYAYFISETEKNKERISFCRSSKDIKRALSENKAAAVLTVEGGAVLGGKIENVKRLYELGVRLMTLTWNGRNELGDGCFCENAGGLTKFGKDVIREMNEVGMIIDVSHLSEKGFYDVCELSRKPFAASHSNLQIVKNERGGKRNLSPEQVKIIIEKKGIIGLNFCKDFLGDGGDDGRQALLRHIYRFLELGAEKNLAFGCDFDGCEINPELCGLSLIPSLFEWLLKRNIPEKTLKAIFFENGYSFLIANL